MIIDPHRDGVYIWTDSNVASIRRKDLVENCKEIYARTVQPRETVTGNIIFDQIYELYIDISGIGFGYKNCLTDMGLKVNDITYRQVDAILPIRCQYPGMTNANKEHENKPFFI